MSDTDWPLSVSPTSYPKREESIDIKLKSNMDRKDGVGEYIETEKYHTGTYTTGSTAKTYIVGGELYPPETTLLLLGIR